MRGSAQGEGNIEYPTIYLVLRMRAVRQSRDVRYTFASTGGASPEVTYVRLDRHARAIAYMATDLSMRGQSVMLPYPLGADYIAAAFGRLRAGVVAVPVWPPDPPRLARSLPRLVAVARDAKPSAALTTAAVDATIGAQLPGDWQSATTDADAVALLQHTSGSTPAPRGAVLTRWNLTCTSAFLFCVFAHSSRSRAVVWLPPHREMGLIGGIRLRLYGGCTVTLAGSADFLPRPLSWSQEISRAPARISGDPIFCYDLCVRKTTEEERSQFDLRSWQIAFNCSEAIHAETTEKIARTFVTAGFQRKASHPFYGLAEGTLIVTGGIPWSRRGTKFFYPAVLRQATAEPGAAGLGTAGARRRRIVSCSFVPAAPSVAQAYWNRPEETCETFGARLAGTGRMKDLISVRGGDHSLQDIELTAERSSPLLRRGCAAAFTVAVGNQERLVIAHEITHRASDVNVGRLASAIRAAVAAEHELQVGTVVLLPPGEMPKTSSGEVRRKLSAVMFTGGQLTELGRSTINPLTEPGRHHLDRSSLLSAPDGARQRRVAASDLADATSIADRAVCLDRQLPEQALPSPFEIPAPAWVRKPTAADKDTVRLYCWVAGSRLPADAAWSADFPPGGSAA